MPRPRVTQALLLACLIAVSALGAPARVRAEADADRLAALVNGPQRSADNRARDRYRNPLATLIFLGIAPTATVIEISPGSAGYWTEIMAPYLKAKGRYVAAVPKAGPDRPEAFKAATDFKARLAGDPGSFDRVVVLDLVSTAPDLGPPASADAVLTFRNLHNWMAAGRAEAMFAAFHTVLRPGGVLGIEEHRGRADIAQDPAARSGYVREDYAIALIEKAGFRLVAKSEVNANPKDTKDYPAGVWTLPPTFRLKDQDRARYAAIGESDRFLMLFVKR